ncbi:hypothetical protein [Brucella pituitosa]|uniref:hypothetical protein n=1 Tax=Brucella pituitosa TaxID=571256 RepID=UPI003F4AEA1A
MALERKKYLYEVLLRFHPQGFAGAHQIHAEQIVDSDTGDVLSETAGMAEPVTDDAVSTLIGSESLALLARISELESLVENLSQQLAHGTDVQSASSSIPVAS